jgi:hypothetical protein
MERFTYKELLTGLEEADAWLSEQGLAQHDRMRINKRNLAFLVQALDDGTLDSFMETASFERRSEVMCSLLESAEFVDSLSALRKQGCTLPAHVLQAALDGPVDLRLETSKSNRARNTMFEIAVAGRFARTGLRPVLGSEPDVLVELHNRRLLIQCKRVFSEAGLPGCLRDASDQLRRDLRSSCDPRDCGVIALSISRMFHQGDRVLVAEDEATLRYKLRQEVDGVRNKLANEYRKIRDPKIAGVLYHLFAPAILQNTGLYTAAHSVTIDHILGKSDGALLEKMRSHLGP